MPIQKKKIAFFDRDGVINKKVVEHQYVRCVEDFHFNDGVFEIMRDLISRGYEIIVITNQRGIARALLTETDLADIHAFMRAELLKKEIPILDIFYCPHNDDVCHCRKPKPGLLEMACAKYPIDLQHSILISDSVDEIVMGEKFGIGKNYFVHSDEPKIML